MNNDDRKPIGYGFAKQVLPPGTPEEEIEAARNVENVIVVLNRICERLVQEKREEEIKNKDVSVL